MLAVEITGRNADPMGLGELLETTPSPWIVGGWLFYNAQFVPTVVPTPREFGGRGALETYDLLGAVGWPLLLFYLVPPLLLIGAGYLAVRNTTTRGVHGDTYGGASVALAYVPPLIVGAFVVTTPWNAGYAPEPLRAIYVGLVYPALCGAVGGKLAGDGSPRPTPSPPSRTGRDAGDGARVVRHRSRAVTRTRARGPGGRAPTWRPDPGVERPRPRPTQPGTQTTENRR